MRSAGERLLDHGITAGVAASVLTHLMLLARHDEPDFAACLVVFTVFASLAGIGAAFLANGRQVTWYRRCVFVPTTVVYGLAIVTSAIEWQPLAWFTLLSIAGLFLGAPAIWLIGAVWIRRNPKDPRLC
jgi:hypothetical protein